MSRRRKILLALLVLVVMIPTGVMYWVATTESGLQFLLNRLHKVGPVTLTAQGVTGTLTRGIHVESLRIEHRLSDVTVEDATGSLRLLPLLVRRRIEVPALDARRVRVVLFENDSPDNLQRTPRFLPPTLRIDGDAVRVGELLLTLRNGRELTFSDISGEATLVHREIRARNVHTQWEDWELSGNTIVHAARPYGLEGAIDAIWRPQNQPEWRMATRFDGDLDALPFDLTVSEPFLAEVKGNGVLRSDWRFEGHALAREFDLTDFGGGDALGLLSGELDVGVDADGITARGQVTPPGLESGPLNVDFNGDYQQKVLTIRRTDLLHRPSGSRATVRGTVAIQPGGPRLDLRGTWATFRWPLASDDPAFTSPQGQYTLVGTKPWQVTAQGDLVTADVPVFPASARGMLDGDHFRIDEARLGLFGGDARLTGEARWDPAQTWRVSGHMQGMDAAQLRGDLPGQLDFDFRANGGPFGSEGSIELAIERLTGSVREQRVRGRGTIARANSLADWNFRGVDLDIGRTHVEMDGALGEVPDFTFRVVADDLSLIDPEARGSLTASGRFAGTRERPVLRLQAQGNGFAWRDMELAALVADINLDLDTDPGEARGTLVLQQLMVGARTINGSLALSGQGENQRLTMAVDAAPLQVRLEGTGGLRDGLWQGQIDSFAIDQPGRLALRNEGTAPLAFNLQRVMLGNLCLKGEPERLCASGDRDANGAWATSFSADMLPLSTFTAGLSQDFQYEGTIDLLGELTGRPNALPTGTVTGHLVDARLRHRVGGREQVMSLGTGTVDAIASTEDFSLRVGLDAGSAGNIQARLEGQRHGTHWSEHPISGSIDARTDSLALIDLYVVEIDRATGSMATRGDIGGTLGAPTLNGTMQLRDASIDLYQINLALRDLNVDASFNTDALQLEGSSRLGDGIARFTGRMSWRDAEPYGDLRISGERLLLVNVPEARILASPDLDFRIAGRRVDVTGEVDLPYARIEPADLTNAVLSSNDEELVGTTPVDPSQRWNIHSNIRLVLGDDVRLESLGLEAKLGGAVEVRSDGPDSSRGTGELVVAEGRYQALGRLLDIERGRLIYNNVPLNDPGIDLRAEKVFPQVVAGVNVRGSLRAPRLTFYSEPALPQSQIASLILAGGSINSLSDSQAPGAARNDLIAQGGAILAQRVGGQVGVDDVGIESDVNDQASLVLGKYLSDRLYVSYGISLAEAINTLKLRWTISSRWTINTEAGQERSAEIVYTLKK